MVTKELYKLEKGKITKDGHTMFEEDIVKDLNGWKNKIKTNTLIIWKKK